MIGIRIGIAVLIATFIGALALTGSIGTSLVITAIVLVILPPEFDPAIQIKERQIAKGEHPESPSCFGEYPFNAGLCAERGCADCPAGEACLNISRARYRKD